MLLQFLMEFDRENIDYDNANDGYCYCCCCAVCDDENIDDDDNYCD